MLVRDVCLEQIPDPAFQRAAKGGMQKGVGHVFLFRSPLGDHFVTFFNGFGHFFAYPLSPPPFCGRVSIDSFDDSKIVRPVIFLGAMVITISVILSHFLLALAKSCLSHVGVTLSDFWVCRPVTHQQTTCLETQTLTRPFPLLGRFSLEGAKRPLKTALLVPAQCCARFACLRRPGFSKDGLRLYDPR